MAWLPKQYTMTASAAQLTTVLGLSSKRYIKQLNIKNQSGAANKIYLGGSGVTNVPANAGAEISADTAWTLGPLLEALVTTDDIYLVGTVAGSNIAFIDITYFQSGA